jgi:hypothetical protein
VDGSPQTVDLGAQVEPAPDLELCIRNKGEEPVFIYGTENVTSSGTVTDGKPSGTDLDLRFARAEPRTFAESLPDAFERAALFRPGWVGAWAFWVLLGLLVIAAPLLLAAGLARAARD